jgi:hypothetical protein
MSGRVEAKMRNSLVGWGSFAVAVALCAGVGATATKQDAELIAHEWGTFTSIAGNEGTAVSWYPWAVPTDLPHFVEEFRARNFKLSLRGTIRMETPVLYFYSAQETQVSVHVKFSKGLITEWYPHVTTYTPKSTLTNAELRTGELEDGSVTWNAVEIRPSDASSLPQETSPSRYYAARATAAAPLRVSSPAGAQHEKFLFYRGVSSESSPVTAQVLGNGDVQVENVSGEPLAAVMIFDRRGDKAGFAMMQTVQQNGTLRQPELNGSVASASEQVLAALMDHGLYPDEARAMLETWKDSWFEEGTRLLYIVPRTFVDRILPLNISPAPAELTRVFVGRMELVSPRTRAAVEAALAQHDEATLGKYNRFLQPVLEILEEQETDPARLELVRERLQRPYVLVTAQAR